MHEHNNISSKSTTLKGSLHEQHMHSAQLQNGLEHTMQHRHEQCAQKRAQVQRSRYELSIVRIFPKNDVVNAGIPHKVVNVGSREG
ncbi:hypothetical protein GBA52_014054 [Prunus armeniaca]|nr:hypothetical protein GBA52_014054 [Prunus armeniaca]